MKSRSDLTASLIIVMVFILLPALAGGSMADARVMGPGQNHAPGIVREVSTHLQGAGPGGSEAEQVSPATLLVMLDTDLRLIGTAVTDDAGMSIAIIESGAPGSQNICHEGDQLGEILIKKILYGKVLITNGQEDAVLLMGGGYGSAGPPSSSHSGRLERKEIDRTFPDYERLMQAMRFRSYFEAGRPAGFVIYNIKPGSIFERMGIENGDVIVNLNGKAFATTQPVVEFYNALKEEPAISLEVKRGDGTQELRVDVM